MDVPMTGMLNSLYQLVQKENDLQYMLSLRERRERGEQETVDRKNRFSSRHTQWAHVATEHTTRGRFR